MTEDAGKEMKARLRADLGSAMKAGRKDEAGVIRELIAALDNAEAVPARVEQASLVRHDFHRGSAEAERRVLGSDAVRQLFLDDVEKRKRRRRNSTGWAGRTRPASCGPKRNSPVATWTNHLAIDS